MSFIALLAALALPSCNEFHLSTASLVISPTPASPGDTVTLSFVLNLVPTQTHTIRVFIDNIEHMSVTNSGVPAIPVTIEIGAAEDLLSVYGEGLRVVHVEVQARDSGASVLTQSIGLDLRASQ